MIVSGPWKLQKVLEVQEVAKSDLGFQRFFKSIFGQFERKSDVKSLSFGVTSVFFLTTPIFNGCLFGCLV